MTFDNSIFHFSQSNITQIEKEKEIETNKINKNLTLIKRTKSELNQSILKKNFAKDIKTYLLFNNKIVDIEEFKINEEENYEEEEGSIDKFENSERKLSNQEIEFKSEINNIATIFRSNKNFSNFIQNGNFMKKSKISRFFEKRT